MPNDYAEYTIRGAANGWILTDENTDEVLIFTEFDDLVVHLREVKGHGKSQVRQEPEA